MDILDTFISQIGYLSADELLKNRQQIANRLKIHPDHLPGKLAEILRFQDRAKKIDPETLQKLAATLACGDLSRAEKNHQIQETRSQNGESYEP